MPQMTADLSLRLETALVFSGGGIMYAYLRNEKGNISFDFLEQSLAILKDLQDPMSLSLINQRLGILSRDLERNNDYTLARKYLEEARKQALLIISMEPMQEKLKLRRLGDSLNGLGSVSALEGDLISARKFLQEADHIFRELSDLATRSSVTRHLAEILRLQGHSKDAAQLCRQAIELAKTSGRKDRLADSFEEMARIELGRNRQADARKWADQAKAVFESIGAIADSKRIENLFK
jgi:tetratricopeptide (TPR) repeat protein